ncbi:YfhO family protein [Marasmitruncus massiliensis]|uniref:YfhO family protein n=1 Tax=Marasmitruncus massiliensis TaxID=1944642 RepID=UPI001FA93C50|nr:YfhO family protein [Marasmitruncus massiliensis]
MELQQNTTSRPCRKAFCIALLTASVIFIPFMIWDKGYFFFFGDFNVQQIPFYKLAHEAVRSGAVFWNWYTDLGANFIGSYSFYLIGSPFFWLTLPFPTEFVPHLMAPLLILKHACAAFTGTLYLKRFVRTPNYAVLGGVLYAFSGFTVYNIFFNHFHEAIICFPLLLVGLEELIVNDRRGLFALSVAINAFINYWFFIGEVVFVILYFIIRSLSPDWKMSFRKFFRTAFESVIGVLLSMCLLLPSVLAIMGNPRTGITELLDGWNFWLYWHCQLYPAIGASAFFPPDLPSRPNLFPDRGAKWASLSAWLPFFSMSGVIAYLQCKRDWLRRILLISFLFALVPGLNSMFILFNGSYYARWYYMPVLLMALATIRALENRSIDLKRGFRWTMVITAATSAILAFTPIIDSAGKVTWGLTKYPERFLAIAAIALAGLIALGILLRRYRESKLFFRMLCGCLCFIIVAYTGTFIGMGKTHSDDTDFIRDVALKGRYQLQLPDSDTFARSDIYNGMDNLGMYWHLPNIQAFHSIIPVSIMDFYPKVGVKRDVSSKPETKYYQLRPLLSVRWLFVKEDEENQDLMPGWELQSTQLGYHIYENQNFIPMGFTYDYYINERDFEKIPEEKRAAVLLRALILPDDDSLDYTDILERMPQEYYEDLGEEDYFTDCQNRRATAGDSFVIDRRGFTSEINLPRENLVFYSVPHDKGWSATVNGEPAEIQKVSIGFMAVRAPAGQNTIRFTYTPPGLYAGIAASAGGLVLLLIYLLLWKRFRKAAPEKERPVECEESDVFYPENEPQAEWLDTPENDKSEDELPKPPEEWFDSPDAPENNDR